MTRIDFHTNINSINDYACRLLRKIFRNQQQAIVYCNDQEQLSVFDQLLWTFSTIDFIPHHIAHHQDDNDAPILLIHDHDILSSTASSHQILVNLDKEIPPNFSRFERLFEFIDQNENTKNLGRIRYKFYRDRGYPLTTHQATN
jgi:DNA polymerase III subunit chi